MPLCGSSRQAVSRSFDAPWQGFFWTGPLKDRFIFKSQDLIFTDPPCLWLRRSKLSCKRGDPLQSTHPLDPELTRLVLGGIEAKFCK